MAFTPTKEYTLKRQFFKILILTFFSGIRQALRPYTVSSSSSPSKESKSHLLLLIIPLTTFGLGTWQVYRLQWKRNLIKELEERTNGPPIEIPAE